jgi:hypothetical protein
VALGSLTDFDVFGSYDTHSRADEACWGDSVNLNAIFFGPVNKLGVSFTGV